MSSSSSSSSLLKLPILVLLPGLPLRFFDRWVPKYYLILILEIWTQVSKNPVTKEDDDVVHCRIYTCGGYAPSLVLVYDSRLV